MSSANADEFDSNGVKIHYTVVGKGERVILVHGLGSSTLMNWQLPGTIKQLSKHFQVIAFDLRGHGMSGRPKNADQYGVQMSEDIVRLMNHLHIQKAQVVGYSLGSFIVMKLLTTHPDRVTAAVLGGAAWLKTGSPLQHIWLMMPARGGMVPPACIHSIGQLATTAAEISQIKVPVRILVGDYDPCRRMYVRPAEAVRPDWEVRGIKGAGHLNCIIKQEFKDNLEKDLLKGQ